MKVLSYVMQPPETNRAHLLIEKLLYGGDGLGRLEGRAVLVPFVLPGEAVRVAIERERPDLVEAKLLEVVSPGRGRTDPPCPHFQHCGGCQYQHAEYALQLEQKRAIVEEVFRRVGKFEPPPVETLAGTPWEYRNRAQFHLERGGIGYFEHGSHRLCPIERCPISSPRINQTLTVLRGMLLDRRFPKFVRSIELFTNETEVQLNVLETERAVSRRFFEWSAERIPGAAAGALDYPVGSQLYRVGHKSFFQANRFLIGALADRALEAAEGAQRWTCMRASGYSRFPWRAVFNTSPRSSPAAARFVTSNSMPRAPA